MGPEWYSEKNHSGPRNWENIGAGTLEAGTLGAGMTDVDVFLHGVQFTVTCIVLLFVITISCIRKGSAKKL